MALKPKGGLILIAAALAVATVIWSSRVISARSLNGVMTFSVPEVFVPVAR